MAKSSLKKRRAMAKYERKYRKEHAKKVLEYERKTVKERASRNKARAKVKKQVGAKSLKGKEIHHKDGNPKNNRSGNLAVRKKGHGGGKKGNQNARKKKR